LKNYKSGFVTLIGRPNVGKSTLINKLIGEKIAITSPVAQTTRKKLKGILTTKNSQIIFIDTPGIHKPHHLLGETLVKNAKSSINGVDLIVLIFDSKEKPGRGDIYVKDFLLTSQSKFIIVLNKWDLVPHKEKDLRLNQYKEIFDNQSINFHTTSSITGEGCNELINLIEEFIPIGPMLYPNDTLSDQPFNILLAELIREQVLINTREEIPHSVAVMIEKIEEVKNKKSSRGENLTAILATIIVEKKSQKGILIGKKGSMLKLIGQSARINMKKLINGPIYLELFVKIIPNWRKKESKLAEFGFEENF
tara:strand:+ start:280 stop:1203 length:924 start_codon:yes stop_codon:yes gene_type:complete